MQPIRIELDNITPSQDNQDHEMQDTSQLPQRQQLNSMQEAGSQGNTHSLQMSDVSSTKISFEELEQITSTLDHQAQLISTMSNAEVDQVRALVNHVDTCQKTLLQRIKLMPYIAKVNNALELRDNAPSRSTLQVKTPSLILQPNQASTKPISTNTIPQNQPGEQVKYVHLYQYQSDLNQLAIRESTSGITTQAQKQLKDYNTQHVIERQRRSKKPSMPFYEIFIRTPLLLQSLTKDQCQLITMYINPDKNQYNREFPQFNPDFQFQCTVFGIHLNNLFTYFKDWNSTHQTSQLTLPQNEGLNINEIEGRFAFDTGSRWIQLKFSSTFNVDWNERIAFYVVNGQNPSSKIFEDITRAFLCRCMNLGAWDGITTYFECSSAKAMGKTLNNLRKLSVYLQSAKYEVHILDKEALRVNTSYLPTPEYYELAMPIHNSWCNLTKRQLTKPLQERFSPCIMFGGVYLPNFANPQYGVTGKMINMIPRFANSILKEQERDLFNWSLTEGCWIKHNGTKLSMHQQYMEYIVPSIDQQEKEHQLSKKFSYQLLDPILDREYGSNHFWTWYRRDKVENQITSTPMSIYSEFLEGENPYNLTIPKGPILDQLIIPSRNLGNQHAQMCYEQYINDMCVKNLEMALRYRRAQLITGFNAPYLSYQPTGTKHTINVRPPTIFEFITRPVHQADLDILRKMTLNRWTWIPVELISQFDEQTGKFYSKRDMLNLRWQQLEQEELQKFEQWNTIKRYNKTYSPNNRKKNKPQ